MTQFLYFMLIIMLIAFILLLINLILSKKILYNREKSSPFECGFDPISPQHSPFSVQFFLISLIFLIFDIELTLIIPLIILISNYSLYTIICMLMFFYILTYSLFLEYSEYSIDWKFS